MRTPAHQLSSALRKDLAPIYLVYGEEPLQIRDALDAIRERARNLGFSERIVLDVVSGFDWNRLSMEMDSLSLFASRRVLEVRMPGGKPGRDGSKALVACARKGVPDTVVLVNCERLERDQEQSAWFKAIDGAGMVVRAYPVPLSQLPGWLTARATRLGLRLTADATRLLAARVEGNLLAAEQELNKLRLLYPEGEVDSREILGGVLDSARHNLFQLADAALGGDATRTLRILRHLREEGTAPPLIHWVLGRDLRALSRLAHAVARGKSVQPVLRAARLPASRTQLFQGALRRISARAARRLLVSLSRVDQAAKGRMPEHNPWHLLERLCLDIASSRDSHLFSPNS